MRTTACSTLLLGLLAVAAVGQAPPAKPASLEDDIARAVRTHPDVAVAEAEAQLAAAKVQQVRRTVALKVAAAKRDRDRATTELRLAAKAQEASARATAGFGEQLDGLKKMGANVSAAELRQLNTLYETSKVSAAEQERSKEVAKAKLAEAEAEYDALVGNTPPAKPQAALGDEVLREKMAKHAEAARELGLKLTDAKPGSGTDKVRTALEKQVTYASQEQHVEDVVKALKTAAGTDVLLRTPVGFKATFTFDKQEMPLAAWLELLRDDFNDALKGQPGQEAPYEWYVREYGLILSANGRPEGAFTLGEFLRAVREKAKADAEPKA